MAHKSQDQLRELLAHPDQRIRLKAQFEMVKREDTNALVDPGADIAEGYGVSTITLKSGSSISGQLGKETKKGIDLILADGSTQKIAAEDVASKTDPISSMPPMGYLLTKRELRDMVAYLASLE